jgi:alkylhydroperoxidase/carboxymuconolactone decarboxylase family protein YurZ
MLDAEEIDRLRAAYDPNQLRAANAKAFADTYPPIAPWADAAAAVFFRSGPLAPRERELCLVTLLTHRAPGLSLSNHIYWALMEGVSIAELCEAIGLAGGYCGLPAYSSGVLVLQKSLKVLRRVAAQPERDSRAVLAALVQDFVGVSL